MLDQTKSLPDDPSELRSVAAQLAATVKSQALRIAKLEHQLAGHRRHRFGSKSETMDQLELALEEEEIAAAKIEPPAPPDTAAEPATAQGPVRASEGRGGSGGGGLGGLSGGRIGGTPGNGSGGGSAGGLGIWASIMAVQSWHRAASHMRPANAR